MDKLLVSGIVYTPIGDPKENHASLIHTRKNFLKQKFPLTIVDQYERWPVGKFINIKQIWYTDKHKGEFPVYYGVGYISHKRTIYEILNSAIHNGGYYHSWCSKFKWIEYSEEKKDCFGRKEWIPTGGRWDKFNGVIACCTPCLNYTSMFLPYVPKKINDAIIRNHKNYKQNDYPAFKESTFKRIKMDQDLFWKLFGDRFKKENYLNFKPLNELSEYYEERRD
jgi:hypothetical protein